MAKQNKVVKLLKTFAVSALCIGMVFPVGVINASSQTVESENTINSSQNGVNHISTTQELKNQEQNLLNQIQGKINSHGGLSKITPQQLKIDIDSVIWFNSELSNKIFRFEMSTKNFDKEIKSKGGYRRVSLIQIREALGKYFAYDHNLQDKLFYEIRSQLLSSRSSYVDGNAWMHDFINGVKDAWNNLDPQNLRWSRGHGGNWYYCNAFGGNCAYWFWRIPSSHHFANGHRDNGTRLYYFNPVAKSLRTWPGWWHFQGHQYYNDGEYGMYTNETYTISNHRYHFNELAHSHRLW